MDDERKQIARAWSQNGVLFGLAVALLVFIYHLSTNGVLDFGGQCLKAFAGYCEFHVLTVLGRSLDHGIKGDAGGPVARSFFLKFPAARRRCH